MEDQDKYADKISKLLRKAESTTPEEADLLIAKAQELMRQYAISEAMLDAARGIERDEIVQEEFIYVGIMRKELGLLGWRVLVANNCKGVLTTWMTREVNGKMYKQTHVYTATGFKTDVDRARMLDASLQVQAASAMASWWKTKDSSWMSKTQTHRERQQFLYGYATAVGARLAAANKAGKAAAIKDESDRTGADATTSVEMVLASRTDRVNDWYDKKYGKTLRSVRMSYGGGSAGAHSAGSEAGRNANIGQTGVDRGQGAIGS